MRPERANSLPLKLAFGMAMGTKIMGLLWLSEPGAPGVALPAMFKWVALFASALAFTVLFRAKPRDAGSNPFQ